MTDFYQEAKVNYPELEPGEFDELLARIEKENQMVVLARVKDEGGAGPILTKKEHDRLSVLMDDLPQPDDHALHDNGRHRAVYDCLIELGFKLPKSRLIAWRKAYMLLWRGYYGQPPRNRTKAERERIRQTIAAITQPV